MISLVRQLSMAGGYLRELKKNKNSKPICKYWLGVGIRKRSSVLLSRACLEPRAVQGWEWLLWRESMPIKVWAFIFYFLKIQVKKAFTWTRAELKAFSFSIESGYNSIFAIFDPLPKTLCVCINFVCTEALPYL